MLRRPKGLSLPREKQEENTDERYEGDRGEDGPVDHHMELPASSSNERSDTDEHDECVW